CVRDGYGGGLDYW
nr:immunoglobulin heavy chain junction region [Macaca mulatta]MOY17899.1 immunoglobulin heavy chain junction region [Macaca mulatta]MOY17900.1 immunoglobulin heavy chain junction region [Macaca mulatta]MOY17906.1 immunoglobulin heavy chain junction region [Macaca mulatta]MOY17917.1 immunoglobulin heavy chain junction region [Macaca mulatta]